MNRTTGTVLTALVLSSIASAPVLAAETGFYLSAGIGRAEEDPGQSIGMNIGIGFPPAGIVHLQPYRVDVDGGDTAWSVGVGYRISRYVAAEVEYMDFGTTDITEYYSFEEPTAIDLNPLFYSSTVKGPSITVLGTLPVGKGFELYVRAGALFADRNIGISQYTGSGSTTFGDTVWLGGAGVDWTFAGDWAIRAEYQRTGDLDSTIVAGETAVERISLSLRYKL